MYLVYQLGYFMGYYYFSVKQVRCSKHVLLYTLCRAESTDLRYVYIM